MIRSVWLAVALTLCGCAASNAQKWRGAAQFRTAG